MEEKLIKELKIIKGSLLCIGLSSPLMLDIIRDNENVKECYLISDNKKRGKKFNMHKKGRKKKVNIKKLSKYFRIKSVDNIICNYNVIKKYIRSFQGESVYINRKKLYIYGDIKDYEIVKEKYMRFSKDIESFKKDKQFLLIIDNEKVKTNIFKNTYYKIKDFFTDTIELLTDLLIN